MTTRTATRAAGTLAVLSTAATLSTLSGGLAHADTPQVPDAGDAGDGAASEAGSGTPVFLLDGLPAAPLPADLLTPVDLTAPVFGVLDGLS